MQLIAGHLVSSLEDRDGPALSELDNEVELTLGKLMLLHNQGSY